MPHSVTRIISAIAPIYDPVIDWFLGDEIKVRRRMADRVGDFERVLDIGCGTGSFLGLLEDRDSGLYGLDISARMLRIARKKHRDIDFLRGSALHLPFRDGSFDAVFSTMMMHHLNEKERGQVIAEIHRVLRSGGAYYSLEFSEQGLTITGRAVTGLGFLEDRHLKGFQVCEKEQWEKGLLWRCVHRK